MLKKILALWKSHGTRILGTLSTAVAALATVPGLFAPEHLKYVLAVNAILGALTVKRGFTNSKAGA